MSPMLRLLRAAVHVVMPVFAVAVLLLTSPAWRAELELRAQTCSPQIRDPECSPLHAPTALITPHIVTTADNHVRITVEVADAVILDATDFSLTQNGTAVSILMTWTGKSGRGWVEPILVSGLNKFLVNVKNFQGTPAKDSAMVTYAPPPPQTAPSFSLTNFSALHHNNFRPGEPCAGCTATLSYAIPAYSSLDLPRSLSLLYSSATAAPTGYVVLGVRQGGTEPPRVVPRLGHLSPTTPVDAGPDPECSASYAPRVTNLHSTHLLRS